MRLDRLDILRYGALTERELDFRAGARLHIVYGPNEAGKSSALRATADLLFGFPAAAEESFLHDAASLRVGATITARNGTTFTFRRRRGRKGTLLAADDREAPLADDALSPFLGHLGRDVFERAFGLNSHRLRQGAAAMLRSGGEIGSLLFSAASGLTGLMRLRQSLDGEADAIYASRRSKDRSFYQAIDRYDAARSTERESELKSGDWKKLTGEAADVGRELADLRETRLQTKLALERLQGLKILQPLLAEVDGETAALAVMADLSVFSADLAEALERTVGDKRLCDEQLRQAESLLAETGEEMLLVRVDDRLLQAEQEITRLFADSGNFRQQRRDLPRVDAELANYDAALCQLARRLGFADASGLEMRQPSDIDRTRLAGLIEDGRRLLHRQATFAEQMDAERQRLSALDGDGQAARIVDPRPQVDQLEALAEELAIVAGGIALETQIARAEANLREAATRLRPPVADAGSLLASPLPDAVEIAAHRQTIDAARSILQAATQTLRVCRERMAEVERALVEAESTGAVVTREQIAAARQTRDALWKDMSAATGTARPLADNAAPFADAMAAADRLADAALADADRVARYAENQIRHVRSKQDHAAAAQHHQESDAALAGAAASFAALFEPARIVPLDPAVMLEWRRGIDGLFGMRQAVNDLLDRQAEVAKAGIRIMPALQAIAVAIGFDPGRLPASALAEGLRRQLRLMSERWSASRTREGEIASARERLTRLEGQQRDLGERLAGWRIAFDQASAPFGLGGETTPDMAAAALQAWSELPDVLAERDNRLRRVKGMRRDMAAFDARMAGVTDAVGADLALAQAEDAANFLHEQLVAARGEQKRLDRLQEEYRRAEAHAVKCREALAAAGARLSALTAELADNTDLPTLIWRLRERSRLEQRLAEARERLRRQADGRDEGDVRVALADFDHVAAELEIERLTGEEARQFALNGELMARASENERQRRSMETGVSAEFAAYEKQAAELEAKELARQWVVLKLAAHMLASSMESYRDRQADPLILRAGEHFSLLTGGNYRRLIEEHDEKDELHLVAERTNGVRVPLSGLSEGTGDQLYLALRLAFLEDYCSRNEPAPLIVDDIFQTFDDERTAAGLRALAGTADRFQTILFTHEMSVAEIAARELGDGLDLIRL
jgi:uncharacterized protein YhaN